MKTIYIPRDDEKLSQGEVVKSKKDGGEVDFVVNSFLEIAELLQVGH